MDPTGLLRFHDFINETDLQTAASPRNVPQLRVLKCFTERDAVGVRIRDGFVVEAAFRRKPPPDLTER
jgi:hypothetical protein